MSRKEGIQDGLGMASAGVMLLAAAVICWAGLPENPTSGEITVALLGTTLSALGGIELLVAGLLFLIHGHTDRAGGI